MLAQSSPVDVRGNLVMLRTAYAMHCDHVNKDETRLLLEQVIGKIVGQPVRVTCELFDGRAGVAAVRNGGTPN